MDQLTKYEIGSILDGSLAAAGNVEFQRITSILSPSDRIQLTGAAAASVDKLQKFAMPQYGDELIALFYAGQYHLSHVNLAYSAISSIVASRDPRSFRLTDTGRLHFVDFGCGTLVVRFAVILAVADALERGQTVDEVFIDSIDPYTPMVNMGIKVWDEFLGQFRHRRKNNERLRWIEQAIDRLANPYQVVQKITLDQVQARNESDVWLSAIHIVYGGKDGNEVPVQEDLAQLESSIYPTVGLITCHARNAQIARIFRHLVLAILLGLKDLDTNFPT